MVPPHLRKRWQVHWGDAKEELPQLLEELVEIDMSFYDIVHTYDVMTWEYETAWQAVRRGGLLCSHDVWRNRVFPDFVSRQCETVSDSARIFNMNGAILGMKRREIDAKLDEIVSFAEVEPFIGPPVKRYSSGMYVRLAFAVAAHLEPDILIVDEVLAVGDQAIQRKCLGKMGSVSRDEGRTVLFVSHNMATVSRISSRALLLHEGRLVQDGTVE
jgi:ABC-type sugar transport system ATPase subunit